MPMSGVRSSIPMKGDSLDEYREEYNKILLEKATGANAIVQDKYMTCLLYTSRCV